MSTILSTILIAVAAIAAAAVTLTLMTLAGMSVLWWIARGESDVNGEKERDSISGAGRLQGRSLSGTSKPLASRGCCANQTARTGE